jgi:hypothetical protein
LESQVQDRFCYYRDLNEQPNGTEEGRRILFAVDGEVRGESVLEEASREQFRFEPITPVRRPLPESPPSRGFTYVDADDCGQYEIEIMGMVHEFRTFKDLMKGLLEGREEARNSIDDLLYAVWVECQGQNLLNREQFSDRIPRSKVETVRCELQVRDCFYPPTDPQELKELYRSAKTGKRSYRGLREYVQSAADFYRDRGRDEVVSELSKIFEKKEDSGRTRVDPKEKVVDRVEGVPLEEIGA